jgi:hypothetical protein
MDYTLIIFTPDTGRTATACATMTDVQNLLVDFVRTTREQNYVIEVRMNP